MTCLTASILIWPVYCIEFIVPYHPSTHIKNIHWKYSLNWEKATHQTLSI